MKRRFPLLDDADEKPDSKAIIKLNPIPETHQPLIHNPTINAQIRNRMLFRDANGVNFGRLYSK